MSKLDPRNREEAFAHQIGDDAKLLMPAALANNNKGFEQTLQRIEGMIQAYRSSSLRAKTKKAIAHTKSNNRWLEESRPEWIDKKHKKAKEHLKTFEKESSLK